MNDLLTNLAQLQALELKEIKEKNAEALIRELRAKIPAQILAHYDRLMVRGKKGIVRLRGQTCSGCHMQVPLAVVMTLMKDADIQLCDNCGRYLYLSEAEETSAPAHTAEPQVASKPPRKRAAAKTR
jgi:predicted  nucleic acid-binding Zn-ribbon protein